MSHGLFQASPAPVHFPQPLINAGKGVLQFREPFRLYQPLHMLLGLFQLRGCSVQIVYLKVEIAQLHHLADPRKPAFRIPALLQPRPVQLRQPGLPPDCLGKVPLYPFAGMVHVHQLLHGLLHALFSRIRDHGKGPPSVHLHVHTFQIGQTDQIFLFR